MAAAKRKIRAVVDTNLFVSVSRYPHLRNLKHFHGIQIVDATAFIEILMDD